MGLQLLLYTSGIKGDKEYFYTCNLSMSHCTKGYQETICKHLLLLQLYKVTSILKELSHKSQFHFVGMGTKGEEGACTKIEIVALFTFTGWDLV